MSKPKQWKQVHELKHADVWGGPIGINWSDGAIELGGHIAEWPGSPAKSPYPQEAEPDGRLWVGSGDAS